jgi:hypothetical protein
VVAGPDPERREDRSGMAATLREIDELSSLGSRGRRRQELRPMSDLEHEEVEGKVRDLWQEYRIAKIGPRLLLDRAQIEPVVVPELAKKRAPRKRRKHVSNELTVRDASGEVVATYGSSSAFARKAKATPTKGGGRDAA